MQTPQHNPRMPIGALLVVGALALLILAVVLVWLWQQWVILELTAPALAFVIRGAVFLVPLAGVGMTALIVWRRYGWRESVAAHWQVKHTEAQRIAPLATSFNYRIDQGMPATVEELPALSAPIEVVKSLDDWMDWADEQPHILLGGRTKAGKTTVATAILARRLANRETVFIIDPHSSGWMSLPTAGRISHEGELSRALQAVLTLYIGRMQEREAHKAATGRELPHDHFGRTTILVDEANAIADMLPVVWATFAKQLASGSRKVGIALLLLAQSPLVEDLKISGKMRANFAGIALDGESVQTMISRCLDKARKAALYEEFQAIGDNYPASAVIGAQVWLLDRDGIDLVREPAPDPRLVWQGWDFEAGETAGEPQPQSMMVMPALIPNTVGSVRVSWLIAHMLEREKPPGELAPIVASLIARVAPNTPRAMIEADVFQRAERLFASGNTAMIAAQLDRDELVRTCQVCGAGVKIAYAIWGGNSNQFYKQAKQTIGDDSVIAG